jgi:O-antigen/teichoic acid export membrane protein
MSGWINTLFLGRYGTTADVGIYKVVLQITTVCGFILLSVNAVAAPKFAELWAKGDLKELGNSASQTSKINFFASLPIFIVIIVFREFILGLFGEEFKVAGNILLFNMIGQFFNIFSGSCGSFLNMTGHQKSFQNILLVSTAFNIIACYFFIPIYGLLGSAICSMIFMSTWNIFSLIYIKRKFDIKTYYWPF